MHVVLVFQMEVDNIHLNKRSDPYEFEDDMTAPAVSMEGFKRTNSVKVCVVIYCTFPCMKLKLYTSVGYQLYFSRAHEWYLNHCIFTIQKWCKIPETMFNACSVQCWYRTLFIISLCILTEMFMLRLVCICPISVGQAVEKC